MIASRVDGTQLRKVTFSRISLQELRGSDSPIRHADNTDRAATDERPPYVCPIETSKAKEMRAAIGNVSRSAVEVLAQASDNYDGCMSDGDALGGSGGA